jgi:hypothetical protein
MARGGSTILPHDISIHRRSQTAWAETPSEQKICNNGTRSKSLSRLPQTVPQKLRYRCYSLMDAVIQITIQQGPSSIVLRPPVPRRCRLATTTLCCLFLAHGCLLLSSLMLLFKLWLLLLVSCWCGTVAVVDAWNDWRTGGGSHMRFWQLWMSYFKWPFLPIIWQNNYCKMSRKKIAVHIIDCQNLCGLEH